MYEGRLSNCFCLSIYLIKGASLTASVYQSTWIKGASLTASVYQSTWIKGASLTASVYQST
ncbi:hypothetical protein BOX15_Mlig023388g1, partial [Macrostomum lignano]